MPVATFDHFSSALDVFEENTYVLVMSPRTRSRVRACARVPVRSCACRCVCSCACAYVCLKLSCQAFYFRPSCAHLCGIVYAQSILLCPEPAGTPKGIAGWRSLSVTSKKMRSNQVSVSSAFRLIYIAVSPACNLLIDTVLAWIWPDLEK